MKELPILFSAPMARALLDGWKTQTRRVMKKQPYTLRVEGFGYPTKAGGFVSLQSEHCLNECPHGKPGDRLWVREAWKTAKVNDHLSPKQMIHACRDAGWKSGKAWAPIEYLADGHRENWDSFPQQGLGRYRHSRFMPHDYSRITLAITEVRVERLQDISEEDAIAEGLHIQIGDTKNGHMWNGPGYHDHHSFDRHGCRTYHVGTRPGGICICHPGRKLRLTPAKCAYRILWESINGAGSWDANPWVWALTFRRVQ